MCFNAIDDLALIHFAQGAEVGYRLLGVLDIVVSFFSPSPSLAEKI